MKNKRLFWLFVIVTTISLSTVYFGFGNLKTKAQEKIVKASSFEKFAVEDSITDQIRGKSTEFVRVKINDFGDRNDVLKYGKIIEDYASFVVLSKNKNSDLNKSRLDFQPLETTINLPNGKFEPVKNPPSETIKPNDEAVANLSGKDYYIVQFGSIATDEWLQSLRDEGADVLQYVPHQAFFVYADGATIGKIAGHSRVRWVGRYISEYKTSPELRSFMSNVKGDRAMFDVAVFGRANLDEVSRKLENSIQGRILNVIKLPNNFFNVLRVEIPLSDIEEIAKIADVVRIDQYEKPRIEDERAAQIISGNYTSPTVLLAPGYDPLTQFGVDGTNVTVSVVDDGISIPGNGGFYVTATNTAHGPLRNAAAGATGGHGHINASIIAGSTPFGILDPTGYNYGRGIAPNANILNIPMLVSGYSGNEANAFNDTVITMGPNGVTGTISNNSWGSLTNSNSYDSYTAQFDGFVQDASAAGTIDPITLVFSAGNSGPGGLSLTRPKAAKNLIAVANSENVRTELGGTSADNMEDLRSSSSRGPTADGRIKPDITAPGTVITGSRAGSCGSVTSCFDANHAYSTGTSHAAPQVAGAAALFTQFWKNTHSGVNPSPALIKAAIINTGQEMSGATTNMATIPNGIEGWGRIYLKNMFNTGVPMMYINQELAFSNVGENVVYNGTVADASKPVRFSLVWTDPPGVGNPALVNNLDLTVQIGTNIYRGNVFSGGNSTTGGSNSTIDNVESVFLPSGVAAGTAVTITINAAALNGNGILGNSDPTDQHFALVAYNFVNLTPTARPPVDFDGDNKTDISIFRPSVGEWWYLKSSNGANAALQFGNMNDKLVPADFTGDNKADFAFWRASEGIWYVLRSEDFSFFAFPFGTSGDIPLTGDFDGDNKADAAIYRPSDSTWYILRSSGGVSIFTFGVNGDIPAVADYDGDGKTDVGIFRPSVGEWWISRSSDATIFAFQFGSGTDKIVQGDYTGDGKADAAFFRPSTGFWFVLRSEDSSFFAAPFGTNGDSPSPGDYDGDGKFDFTVFRPSDSTWYIQRSTSGVQITAFGTTGDISVPNVFVP